MMKKFAAISFAAVAALASTSAMAFFDSKDKWEEPECWYNPHDCNPYDEWDPRYWMEEFEQMWDDDDYGYGMPFGGPMGGYGMPYGGPMGGYGMPYGGAPMMAPGGYGMPYGAPMMRPPMAPQMQAPQAAPQMQAPQAAPQAAPRAPYAAPYAPRMPYAAPARPAPAAPAAK